MKKFKQVGSIALKVQQGKALSELSRRLTLETLDRDIQIITVSNLEAYREYAPYKIMKDQLRLLYWFRIYYYHYNANELYINLFIQKFSI